MSETTASHYERLANNYDGNWAHSGEYVEWMNHHIATDLAVPDGARVADVGAGTGLFVQGLLPHISPERPLLCIDPIKQMLDQLPDDPRLRPVHAGVEAVVDGTQPLPYPQFDAVLCKETIHHAADVPAAVRGMSRLLAPGGRVLIVSLPPHIDYPLFPEALERFAARHPEPDDMAAAMRAEGLTATVTYRDFKVSVDREHYVNLVRRQWMSVLSTFTDEEMDAGCARMRRDHPEPVLNFVDRFAFVLGDRPA